MYKSKQERSFKVVFKHIHALSNIDNIRKEIEDQLMINTQLPIIRISMRSVLHYNVKFELPHLKYEIP